MPQGMCALNIKFVSLQTAKLNTYASVAMVTVCPWQQVRALIAVASVDLCYKYEVHLPSNSKNIRMCSCYNGNKVYISNKPYDE